MKIAALADIHGNYQALITVIDHIERWDPDLVLVLGDVINRGPRSKECLHLIFEKISKEGWKLIWGNHEGYVLNFADPEFPRSGLEFELRKIIFWTYQSLQDDEIDFISTLPKKLQLDIPGNQLISAWHASTAGDRIGIYPDTPEIELVNLIDPNANLFLVGHTHQPLVRKFNGALIINVGSVGLPFDGDKRAAYAQVIHHQDHWQIDIKRIDYDLPAATEDFYQTDFIPQGGPLAELVLAELKLGWPQLSHWFKRYQEAILQGEITIDEAVADHLKNPHVENIRSDIITTYP